MKAHELDIDSIVLAEMRMKLNNMLDKTVRTMKSKGLNEGTVSVKIKIGMIESTDENGEVHTTAIFEPKVTSKVGSSHEDKCGGTGGRITFGSDGQVLIGSEQVTMDELMEEKRA